MKADIFLTKVRRTIQCLEAHPDNEENSEFADRICDLKALEKEFYLSVVVNRK